jgi:hypothetical protein
MSKVKIDLGYLQYKIKLCLRAKSDPDNSYAIFIDEINQGMFGYF